MTATILPFPEHDRELIEQGESMLDRLVELRRALHGMLAELSLLRRDNAALRREVARLERELRATRESD